MVDGLIIHVDEERAALLEIAAGVLDVPVADYGLSILDRAIGEAPFRFVDPDPAIDRAILDEAKRTGNTVPWPEVRDRLLRRHTDDTANTP